MHTFQANLARAGFVCLEQNDFELFRYLTYSTQRVICAEKTATDQGPITPFGISFWVHESENLFFLGFWSGVFYRVSDRSVLGVLAKEILSGRFHANGKAPWNLPDKAAREYCLQRCDLITLCGENDAETLDEAELSAPVLPFGKEELMNILTPVLDACTVDLGGFITLSVGRAAGMTRFPTNNKPSLKFISVLCYDGIRETSDQVKLLSALGEGLNCSIYETCGWGGNKIHLDDPYYMPPNSVERPSEPSNAWTGGGRCNF